MFHALVFQPKVFFALRGGAAWEDDVTGAILNGIDRMQSWILLAIIGVFMGVIAGMLDSVVNWVSDLKVGYCAANGWLSTSVCCIGYENYATNEGCETWRKWSVLLPEQFMGYAWYFDFFMFVLVSVGAAGICAWLVVRFSGNTITGPVTEPKHASGSGIPEIKTILGGIELKGYLGGWTLLIKSVSIVLAVRAYLSPPARLRKRAHPFYRLITALLWQQCIVVHGARPSPFHCPRCCILSLSLSLSHPAARRPSPIHCR